MITHFENLPIDQFLDVIKNMDKHLFTEKIDGANMQIGKDDRGVFTSREQKGGRRFYKDDYKYITKFSEKSFSFAHDYVMRLEENGFFDNFKSGDILDTEIIAIEKPNVILYDKKSNNGRFLKRIVVLRTYSGNVDIEYPKDSITVVSNSMFLKDTGSLEKERSVIINSWILNCVPPVMYDDMIAISKSDIVQNCIKKLEQYNTEILNVKFNKKPDQYSKEYWRKNKSCIKTKKNILENNLMYYKMQIKNEFVKYIRNIKSEFSDTHDGIEGVVIRNPFTKFMTKIVDKDRFTKQNEYNWIEREKLKYEVLEPTIIRIADTLGYKDFGIASKRYKYIDDSELLSTVIDSIPLVNFSKAAIIANKIRIEIYDRFNAYMDKYTNKQLDYDIHVHKKTVEYYADAIQFFESVENGLCGRNLNALLARY